MVSVLRLLGPALLWLITTGLLLTAMYLSFGEQLATWIGFLWCVCTMAITTQSGVRR